MKSLVLPLLIALQVGNPTPGLFATEGTANHQNSVLVAMSAPPLAGVDAFRFSTEPQLGGQAIVVEATKLAGGSAAVRVYRFSGHPRETWDAQGQWSFALSGKEYLKLASQIDGLLWDFGPRESVVCTDGPGILVERVTSTRSIWRRGSCGTNHPNDRIAKLIKRLVERHVGKSVTKDAFRFL